MADKHYRRAVRRLSRIWRLAGNHDRNDVVAGDAVPELASVASLQLAIRRSKRFRRAEAVRRELPEFSVLPVSADAETLHGKSDRRQPELVLQTNPASSDLWACRDAHTICSPHRSWRLKNIPTPILRNAHTAHSHLMVARVCRLV